MWLWKLANSYSSVNQMQNQPRGNEFILQGFFSKQKDFQRDFWVRRFFQMRIRFLVVLLAWTFTEDPHGLKCVGNKFINLNNFSILIYIDLELQESYWFMVFNKIMLMPCLNLFTATVKRGNSLLFGRANARSCSFVIHGRPVRIELV